MSGAQRFNVTCGGEIIAADVTREEAIAIVRENAIAALVGLLEQGSGYPMSVVVLSPLSVALDAGGGAVTQLIARPAREGVEISETAVTRPVLTREGRS